MNDLFKLFANKKNLKLQDNEESYILVKDEDFEDPEKMIPEEVKEVLVTCVSTEDDEYSVCLVHDMDKTFYFIRLVNNETGKYTTHKIEFVQYVS